MSFAKIEAPLLGFWVFSPKPPPPLDHADPGPKPQLHPTPSRSPLSKNELSPTMCSPKLSPGGSDFGFCHHHLFPCTPLHCTPHHLKSTLPHPQLVHFIQKQAPRYAFTETEPQRLSFFSLCFVLFFLVLWQDFLCFTYITYCSTSRAILWAPVV